MPNYAYECADGHDEVYLEKLKNIDQSDEPEICPECGKAMHKVLARETQLGVVFKGSGFHVNDYPQRRSRTE